MRLTEEHLQTNQAADETVEVDGVTCVGVSTNDLLNHSAVHLETCKRTEREREVTAGTNLFIIPAGNRVSVREKEPWNILRDSNNNNVHI